MTPPVKERVYRVVAGVLNVPVERITDESDPDTITSWDSLSHLTLVLALESEFHVTLTDDDVTDMLSVGLICRIVTERGAVDA
jgi:acyl carrier protein